MESKEDEKYAAIILKIDGQEFELDKNDVSNLDGIITAVFDRMIYPFDAYLGQAPKIRINE